MGDVPEDRHGRYRPGSLRAFLLPGTPLGTLLVTLVVVLVVGLAGTLAGALVGTLVGSLVGTSFADATPDVAPVRVMSFNLRYGTAQDGDDAWPHRQEFVADVIAAFSPDLLGTQECLALQADYLREQLPEYGFVGVGRDDGARGGEMCAIFYRRERFEKLDEGHFWLSETPAIVASKSWDSALTRMATWVKLRPTTADAPAFYLLNTHFDHVGVRAREESARVILSQLAAIAGEADRATPVIITGDFNAPADTCLAGPYRVFMRPPGHPDRTGHRYADPYATLHPAATASGTFNAFDGRRDGPRIDWILASETWVPVEADILRTSRDGRYPSDHFPVTAVLSTSHE